MPFSREQLDEIEREYVTIAQKHLELMSGYLNRIYCNPRAREYATHGFMRRVKTLTRCIQNVFEILPPDRVTIPTTEELSDSAINIQAFVFNVFGCADNLAWIYVFEKGVLNTNGSELRPNQVGLRVGNARVRESFSPEFRNYLAGLDAWFEYQENFRHALAHRIPLYIPPYVVHPDNEAAYQSLEERMTSALNLRDVPEYDRLSAEQEGLGVFSPRMTHSFAEARGTIMFHSQLIADFNTIDELGRMMLQELVR